jgi:hypothetical protein
MTIAITNDIDALATALMLAITATTKTQHDMAMEYVHDYAATMSESQVQKAKLAALNQIKNQQN